MRHAGCVVRSPEIVGRWTKWLFLTLAGTADVALLGWTVWRIWSTGPSPPLLALASLACGWLLVVVDRFPPWRG